jgi:hypothetical protein
VDSKENDDGFRKKDDIRVLKLYPHAMQQANAYYSPDAQGIPCSVFFADNTGQDRNLPGQRVSPVSRKTSSRMSDPPRAGLP